MERAFGKGCLEGSDGGDGRAAGDCRRSFDLGIGASHYGVGRYRSQASTGRERNRYHGDQLSAAARADREGMEGIDPADESRRKTTASNNSRIAAERPKDL